MAGAEIPELEPTHIRAFLKSSGFSELAKKVGVGVAMDFEIESALRVILLHRRIPYIPLSMSANADYERYMSSFGVSHEMALRNPEVARFHQSLPEGVGMVHIHEALEEVEPELGPGYVIVVQAHRFDFIIEEHYTLIRAD
jgi:hypothetical protein